MHLLHMMEAPILAHGSSAYTSPKASTLAGPLSVPPPLLTVQLLSRRISGLPRLSALGACRPSWWQVAGEAAVSREAPCLLRKSARARDGLHRPVHLFRHQPFDVTAFLLLERSSTHICFFILFLPLRISRLLFAWGTRCDAGPSQLGFRQQ